MHSAHGSLQFLPHLDSSDALADAAPLLQQQAVFVPTDLSGDALPLAAPPPLPLPPRPTTGGRSTFELQPAMPRTQQPQQEQQPRAPHQVPPAKPPMRVHVHRPARAAAAAAAAARASAASAAAKPAHSIVEKQRRDRINNLIDEVRESYCVALKWQTLALCLTCLTCRTCPHPTCSCESWSLLRAALTRRQTC